MSASILSSDTRRFCPSAELAKQLVEEYGSPLYVYDEQTLLNAIETVQGAFNYENCRFAFAAVTNGNLNLLKIFKNANWGLHANTPGDAFLGIKSGFTGNDIVYSGSNLSSDEMDLMLSWGVRTFNLDSGDQLRSLIHACNRSNVDKIKIGMRLNLPSVTGESRTGVDASELPALQALAQESGFKVSGIHFYRGTSTNATERFVDAFEKVVDVCERLENFEYLDFGGGFGFPYHDRRHSFDWRLFAEELCALLARRGLTPELIIEPGRSVIAGSAVMLCNVISTKWQGQKQLVGVNATSSNIAVLSVHGGSRQVSSFVDSSTQFTSDVCGNTTYSRDYLARGCELPALKEGDVLAIHDTGAYGFSMSSHFLHRPLPAEVLVSAENSRLIRKRETWDCLLANQVISESEC